KSFRLQELLSQRVAEAVRESSEAAILEMKDSILKELDYQFRLQGEREEELQEKLLRMQEEHFAQLDAILREKNDRRKKRLWGGDVTANISVLGDLWSRWQWRGSCTLLIF
ncbi:MAG: hypothetical protein LUE87_09080, partial [Lachnospiraceae bacterium]|nr:hypothetical protein [Lachnospiraceae bacterium]